MGKKTIDVEKSYRAKNSEEARALRKRFAAAGVFVINIMSSPGAGKTSMLELTAKALKGETDILVIEGDLETDKDAARIKAAGFEAVQINTEGGCRLSAKMVMQAVEGINLAGYRLVIIENVGNLVCPATMDIGEDKRVVLLSVTEGDDKVAKYPVMFLETDMVVINKTDLLEHVDFDVESVRRDIQKLNPAAEVIELSCRTGERTETWLDWIRSHIKAK